MKKKIYIYFIMQKIMENWEYLYIETNGNACIVEFIKKRRNKNSFERKADNNDTEFIVNKDVYGNNVYLLSRCDGIKII